WRCFAPFSPRESDLSHALSPGFRPRGAVGSTASSPTRDLSRQPRRIGVAHLHVGPEFCRDGRHRHLPPEPLVLALPVPPSHWSHRHGALLQHAGSRLLLVSSSIDAPRV